MSVPTATQSKPTRTFRKSLVRTMLLLLLPLSLLPVLLMGAVFYYRAYILIRGQIGNQVKIMVEAESNQISARMMSKDNFLGSLINRSTFTSPIETALSLKPASPSYPAVRQQIISEFEAASSTESERSFDRIVIVKPDETVLIASNPNWEGLSLSGSLLGKLSGKKESIALYNGAPIYSNRFLLYSARPYINKQGRFIATIIGISESPAIRKDLEVSLTIHPSAKAYFYSQDGVLIGLDPKGQSLITLPMTDEQIKNVLPLLAGMSLGVSKEYLSFNRDSVLAYVKWIPEMQTGLFVELPQQVIYGPVNKLVPFSIILLIITAFVAGFFIWIAIRRLVKPIRLLTEQTRSFADGEWQQRAIINRDDEIGYLAFSFNEMADELTGLYRSLESKVEERTKQIRIAAEVAQIATSAHSTKELLERIVTLIVERFEYYNASVFLVDDTRTSAILSEYSGVVSKPSSRRELQLDLSSNSMVCWVISHNQSRIATDVTFDPLYLKDDLLPDTRSEAVVPVAMGDYVIGALDVQSEKNNAFKYEDIAVLQTLANQVATAIQNNRLLEATQINLEEASLLYHASRQIAEALTIQEIYDAVSKALTQTSYINALLTVKDETLKVESVSYPGITEGVNIIDKYPICIDPLKTLLTPGKPLIIQKTENIPDLPFELLEIIKTWNCEESAFIPILPNGELTALIILGNQGKVTLSSTILQPYTNLAELTSTAMEKVDAQINMEKRLNELQTLNMISQSIATQTESAALYQVIHSAIAQVVGLVNFMIALYDAQKDLIHIPYLYNGEKVTYLDPFPIGEGLTSILIREGRPMLLSHLDENRLEELGAKVIGAPAKSWLGVPLIVHGEVIGALILQDHENEERFSEGDLGLLSTLAAQIAASIRNTLLLEQTREQAERERLLAEITNKVRASSDISTILQTAVLELGKAARASEGVIQLRINAEEEF